MFVEELPTKYALVLMVIFAPIWIAEVFAVTFVEELPTKIVLFDPKLKDVEFIVTFDEVLPKYKAVEFAMNVEFTDKLFLTTKFVSAILDHFPLVGVFYYLLRCISC